MIIVYFLQYIHGILKNTQCIWPVFMQIYSWLQRDKHGPYVKIYCICQQCEDICPHCLQNRKLFCLCCPEQHVLYVYFALAQPGRKFTQIYQAPLFNLPSRMFEFICRITHLRCYSQGQRAKFNQRVFNWKYSLTQKKYIEGILPKGPYLPCVSFLAGYHRYFGNYIFRQNIFQARRSESSIL